MAKINRVSSGKPSWGSRGKPRTKLQKRLLLRQLKAQSRKKNSLPMSAIVPRLRRGGFSNDEILFELVKSHSWRKRSWRAKSRERSLGTKLLGLIRTLEGCGIKISYFPLKQARIPDHFIFLFLVDKGIQVEGLPENFGQSPK